MSVRFKTIGAFPPTGSYEYECGGVFLSSKSRIEICNKVSDLRRSQGLPVVGDPLRYVMEYMCPRLPDGFCTGASSIKNLRADEVKAATARLFPLPCVPVDEIERRLSVCLTCKKHVTRGFCMGCSGLIDWIYKGFGGRRNRLPPDSATGVCPCSLELVAASAAVDRPQTADASYPDGCWRKLPEVQNVD